MMLFECQVNNYGVDKVASVLIQTYINNDLYATCDLFDVIYILFEYFVTV